LQIFATSLVSQLNKILIDKQSKSKYNYFSLITKQENIKWLGQMKNVN
jgi:hypothetical protein